MIRLKSLKHLPLRILAVIHPIYCHDTPHPSIVYTKGLTYLALFTYCLHIVYTERKRREGVAALSKRALEVLIGKHEMLAYSQHQWAKMIHIYENNKREIAPSCTTGERGDVGNNGEIEEFFVTPGD